MAITTIYNTSGSILVNDDWTDEDNAFFEALGQSRGFPLNYEEKEAYYNRFKDCCNGGGGGGITLAFHFGTLPDSTLPAESEIEALTAQAVPSDHSKVITFTNSTDEILGFAYPATEPDPTQYYIGPLDNGALGSGGTFGLPVTVGAYRLIMSNYATQIPTSVTFS